MTQKKQGLTSRGAKKRTAPVKRYADGDKVSKYPYTDQPAPTAQDMYGSSGVQHDSARVTAPPGSVGGPLSNSGSEGPPQEGGSIRNLSSIGSAAWGAAKSGAAAVGGVFSDSAQAQREGKSYSDVRAQRAALGTSGDVQSSARAGAGDTDYAPYNPPQKTYSNGSTQSAARAGGGDTYGPARAAAEQTYQNVGNAGGARFNAGAGQLSFTDKNFDPTKQQFAAGTGAITGRGGRTTVYSDMGGGGIGGGSNPYASGSSEHNMYNYGGKTAVDALAATRRGGDVHSMAQQLAARSAERMGGGQGIDSGPSVSILRSNEGGMQLTPYRPLGGGMTHGLVPASQRHAEAAMYATDTHAQTAAEANQTARRGQDMGMQSHLQGLDISGQYGLQNTGLHGQYGLQTAALQGQNQLQTAALQGQNQLQNTGLHGQYGLQTADLQGQNQLRGVAMQGQNQLQNIDLHNQGALNLEQFKSGTPQAQANTAYAQQHAGLAGAQQRAIDAGLQNENIAQKQIRDIVDVMVRAPENMGKSNDELWAMAREQHGLNRPQVQTADTSKSFNALQPTPEERLEFQRTGKLPARLAAAAAGHAQGYAEGGQVAPKETAEQIMARMANKYGVAAPQQPAQAPAPRSQAPAPQQGGLSALPDTIRNRNEELRRVANYADGGPIAVGGHQVTDPSGRMDHTGSDSLPAVIDGDPAHPAALTSGEFVFPVEAVQHYGTDRLRKMVAAARKGGPLATGRQAA